MKNNLKNGARDPGRRGPRKRIPGRKAPGWGAMATTSLKRAFLKGNLPKVAKCGFLKGNLTKVAKCGLLKGNLTKLAKCGFLKAMSLEKACFGDFWQEFLDFGVSQGDIP